MITLKEAIEILTTFAEPESIIETERLHEAKQLGIEAMKYHLYRRSEVEAVGSPLLPGETKE